MYVPSYFAVSELAKLQEAMERYSFATLASGSGAELFASHLPLLLERDRGPQGTLVGHMARANPQWRMAAQQEVLAIFHGPHAYISPTWYRTPQLVPTWNYVAVHAYGRLELMEDDAEVETLLKRMIAIYEAGEQQPWKLDEPAEFVSLMLKQIVAFRIPIERLEGKWKLNQNRTEEQRGNVIDELKRRGGSDSLEVARLMEDFRF